MGRKYIYGKMDPYTTGSSLQNEFHEFSVLLGVFLEYCKIGSSNLSFREYVKTVNVNLRSWEFASKAHKLIRDRVNEKYSLNISRRQVRKLGCSSCGCIPMFPKKGIEIERYLFDYIIGDCNYCHIVEVFVNQVYEKWNEDHEKQGLFLKKTAGNDAIRYTAIFFSGFQSDVLEPHHDIKVAFLSHPGFADVQMKLEERGK